MKHITLLYPEGQCNLSTISCIVGTIEIFTRAGGYWMRQGNKQKYKISIAATAQKEAYIDGLVSLKPDTCISDIAKTDLIIIPSAMPGNPTIDRQEMFDWINRQ